MSTTIGGVRIVDMPDLGAVNDSSSVVGERAGSGRFALPAMRSYMGNSLSYLAPYTGAVSRTFVDKFADVVSVKDFGAKGDGTTDDTAAIQAAFTAAAATGATIVFPTGKFIVSSTLTISIPSGTTMDNRMPDIRGAGSRSTVLTWTASSTDYAGISYVGTAANNIAALDPVKISGLALVKPDARGWGLALTSHSHVHVEDVLFYQWKIGCTCSDVQEATWVNVAFAFCLGGLQATRATFTEPNSFCFLSCYVGGNQNYGIDIQGGGAVSFLGGSIQSNGAVAGAGQFGIRTYNAAGAVQESSAGLTLVGVNLERNAGMGDIHVLNNGFASTLTVIGCSFNRADPLGTGLYGTNCIRLEATGGMPILANISGCGFKGLGGYPPSATRPYIGIATAGQPILVLDSGNYYGDIIEAPLWPQGTALASLLINGTGAGTMTAPKNIASFVKNATGDYTVTLNYPAKHTNLSLTATSDIGGSVKVITATETSVHFQWLNPAGVAADPTYLSLLING